MDKTDLSPQWHKKAFTCPRCGVYAHMTWRMLLASSGSQQARSDFHQSVCARCDEASLWYNDSVAFQGQRIPSHSGILVWPVQQIHAPKPHTDMPADCVADFEEARTVAAQSPRSAAALLRLCVQKLCKELGCKGDNINDDIGALVNKGLPVEIKKALDVVRVVGNNAVHPGKMSLEDTPEVATSLFGLVNFIVERMISQPKQIEALHDLLPPGQKAAIEARDSRAAGK